MSKLLWWCNYLICVTELLFSICGGLLPAWPWGTPDGLVRGKKCGRHHSQICELKQKNKIKTLICKFILFVLCTAGLSMHVTSSYLLFLVKRTGEGLPTLCQLFWNEQGDHCSVWETKATLSRVSQGMTFAFRLRECLLDWWISHRSGFYKRLVRDGREEKKL